MDQNGRAHCKADGLGDTEPFHPHTKAWTEPQLILGRVYDQWHYLRTFNHLLDKLHQTAQMSPMASTGWSVSVKVESRVGDCVCV